MPDLFSISAMFILFRETLEACVIISVMLQLCLKLKLKQLRLWGTSLSLSLAMDVCVHPTSRLGARMQMCGASSSVTPWTSAHSTSTAYIWGV